MDVDIVGVVCMSTFYSLRISVGVWGRAALGRFRPGFRRGFVGMGADKGKPALSRLASAGSSTHERKHLGVVEAVCLFYFYSRDNRRVRENKDRFDFNTKTDPGIIVPATADVSRRRLGAGGRKQPGVGTSATGHGLHPSARETGFTET